MPDEMKTAVEGLLGEFYGDVDWRSTLNGEKLSLDTAFRGKIGEIETVGFKDGVRQVAPPKPFDSKRCAWALKQAIEKKGA